MREPYDPLRICEALKPEQLAAGCAASVFSDEGLAVCGRPPVALRRWESREWDGPGDWASDDRYAPVCRMHAKRDVIPMTEVLKALQGQVGYHRAFDGDDLEACLHATMFDWILHDGDWMPKDAIPVEITGWEETPNTVKIFALSVDGMTCEAVYKGQLDGFLRERISRKGKEPEL